MHPLPATREDKLGVNNQTTIDAANTAAGSGLHDADCSMEKILGRRLRECSKMVTATDAGRCGLAEWSCCCRITPKLSLWDVDPLSRKGCRCHLAGRMWSYPISPHVSLTDPVTLSRKRRHITLAGRTRSNPIPPHLSQNADTKDPRSPMRSRGKRVCHLGGHDVRVMWHDESVICLEIFDRTVSTCTRYQRHGKTNSGWIFKLR